MFWPTTSSTSTRRETVFSSVTNGVVVDSDLVTFALRAIDEILDEKEDHTACRECAYGLCINTQTQQCSKLISYAADPTRESSFAFNSDAESGSASLSASGDYLRSWFLSNLAHPFPTRRERQKMAAITRTSVRSIESKFTNWRRRSGWSSVRDQWGGQNKAGMWTLLQRYNAGTLEPEAFDAVTHMRSYFARGLARSCIEEVGPFWCAYR